jgi:hypothetical protein
MYQLFANIHKLRLQSIALVTEVEPKIDEMDTAQNWKNYILCSTEEKVGHAFCGHSIFIHIL